MVAVVSILWLLLGFALLIAGAEGLVRGASRLALVVGLSPLVIGLVVVSLGTSAPEIAISTGAALEGKADLALGNVVGSNIFNVLFILGLTAMLAPLVVRTRLVRLDIPLMVAMGLVLVALALDHNVSLVDGILLLLLGVAYTVLNLWLGRKEVQQDHGEAAKGTQRRGRPIALAIGLVAVGLAALVVGARFTVDAASDIARGLGANDLVIGLTVVAAGTSLPEVTTSVLAALRGERDIAIGNVVGSNILNIAIVLGIASVVSPTGIAVAAGALTFDLPVMVAASLALLPMAFTRQLIARWEGGLFLVYYAAYVAFLFLTATIHPGADELARALVWFAIPLTLIVLLAASWQEWRRRTTARQDG